MPSPRPTFADQAKHLAWGAWSELGVSSWTRSHDDWAIDPEPLILFTAWLDDARLRDEALDWCIRNWRSVSKVRLKNLLARQPDEVREAFGPFAATVGARAGTTWPGATRERRSYRITGKSSTPALDRPSLAWLRLRTIFGLGARTEILRCFLDRGRVAMGVARLADLSGYAKRNVADECDALARAGMLSVRTTGNRFSYTLARRGQLESLVGDLPEVRPPWTPLLNVVRELVTLEEEVERSAHRTVPVKVRAMLDRLEDDLAELEIDPPPPRVVGDELWPAVRSLGDDLLGAWADGAWPAEDVRAEVRPLRR